MPPEFRNPASDTSQAHLHAKAAEDAHSKCLEIQRFVEQHLAHKHSLPYVDLLAVRDALKPYVEDMNDAGWYLDCEASYAQLRSEWQDVNHQIKRYQDSALQRWRAKIIAALA